MQKYSIWFKYTFKEMLIIGIAGGTGSGKTTVVRKIIESLPAGEVVLLPQDSYYKDSSHVPVEERQNINFDHPDAFEWSLLSKHIMMLKEGRVSNSPPILISHARASPKPFISNLVRWLSLKESLPYVIKSCAI